jgi:hypothetical protein
MFDATVESVHPNRVDRYWLRQGTKPVSFESVLELWQGEPRFRNFFTQLLASSRFPAFRWETPALTSTNLSQPFQFVLLDAPGFVSRKSDSKPFRHHFGSSETDGGVVSFPNLHGDATLIVPSPRTAQSCYGHLAAFLRQAPQEQIDAFWIIVSRTVNLRVGERPLWLSTAGGGIAWLHVRIDSQPKYYGFSPYQTV